MVGEQSEIIFLDSFEQWELKEELQQFRINLHRPESTAEDTLFYLDFVTYSSTEMNDTDAINGLAFIDNVKVMDTACQHESKVGHNIQIITDYWWHCSRS